MQIYFLERKFISWNVIRLLTHFESKVVLLNLSNNKKTYDFTRTEKEHWLHSLMLLKDNNIAWPEKTRISANSNYTINWKFFFFMIYIWSLLQEII